MAEKIAIIGVGQVGARLGTRLAQSGFEVLFGILCREAHFVQAGPAIIGVERPIAVGVSIALLAFSNAIQCPPISMVFLKTRRKLCIFHQSAPTS